jgi:plastocyanin
VLALALVLAACGAAASTSIPPDTVQLANASLAPTSITVAVNTTVHFVDEPSGAMHQLCLGQNGACHSSANGPQPLIAPGFRIDPGQTKDVTFSAKGTFAITCTIHPPMNVTITVR